jgi:hypothetical protein
MARRLDPVDFANIRMNGSNLYDTQIRNENRVMRLDLVRNRDIYGTDLDTSRFICRTMRLDIPEDQYGDYNRVVEAALEQFNEVKTEIHFTPYEDSVSKKLRFIYDKIVSDTKNHICNMLKLRETHELCKKMTNQQVIQESSQILRRYYIEINENYIEIDENLKMGEKITALEDKIYELLGTNQMSKGGNKRNKSKSRRRNKSKSRRRNKSKRYKK